MKQDFCVVTAAGTVVRDVKNVTGKEGTVGLNGTLVINKLFLDLDGSPRKTTTFIDFLYWCKADVASQLSLKKGDHVNVEGEIVQRTWEDEGQKRYKHELKLKSMKKSEL